VGIVDCAPRCFTRAEMLAFKALGLRGFMRGWAHRHHATLTKLRRMSWIKPASFQTSLTELRDSFGGAEWLVIPIAPANSSYIRHSPRIAEQISAYNDILQHVFAEGFVGEAFEGCDVEGLFADDMHHLLPHGHRHLARVIVRRLEALDDA